MSLTIAVGTGRCGSTMVSNLMRTHPEVVSISEFWNAFRNRKGSLRSLPDGDMTGEEFWHQFTTPSPAHDHLVKLGVMPPPPSPPFKPRFDYATTGMPPLYRMIARFHDPMTSPDWLYDELALVVPRWPRRPVADQARALFAEFSARLGRPVVLERSGSTLVALEYLYTRFPEARFVFLYRDGADTALSMSRYPDWRLSVIRDLPEILSILPPEQLAQFPPEVRAMSPEEARALIEPPFDKERFEAFPIPLNFCGWVWSGMMEEGARVFRGMPHDQWMTLRYELLLTDPRAELARLADFTGASADEQWLDRACPKTDPRRMGSAAAQLQPGELAELRAACAPGSRAFDLLEAEHLAVTR
jgi:hypothetical protein